MSRKRKVDADGRKFQENWENKYMFVLEAEKPVPVCLLCHEQGQIKQWANWAVAPGPALLLIFSANVY